MYGSESGLVCVCVRWSKYSFLNGTQGGDAGVKDGERYDFDGGGRREGGDLNQFSERTEGGGVH